MRAWVATASLPVVHWLEGGCHPQARVHWRGGGETCSGAPPGSGGGPGRVAGLVGGSPVYIVSQHPSCFLPSTAGALQRAWPDIPGPAPRSSPAVARASGIESPTGRVWSSGAP